MNEQYSAVELRVYYELLLKRGTRVHRYCMSGIRPGCPVRCFYGCTCLFTHRIGFDLQKLQ